MAVSSKKHILGKSLFFESFKEKADENESTFYETKFNIENKVQIIKTNFKGNTLPGILAYLYYTGSIYFLFFGMFTLCLIASLIELLAYKFSYQNMIFAGLIDRTVAAVTNDNVTGVLLGGFGVLVCAYIVRFQAVGYGATLSGVRRLPDNMMSASRVLGHDFGSSLRKVILPLLRGSLVAGALLVFVDVMKELPMTLLLRPFDFETLATFAYQFAKDEMLEEAALPSLMIVIVGLVPVLLMNRMLRQSR